MRDIRRTTVTELFRILKNDSYGDFQHSKQFKFEEKYLPKHSKIHKGKQTFSGKSELQMFFPISSRHVCAPQRDTNMVSPY